jgi:hypothetical protein
LLQSLILNSIRSARQIAVNVLRQLMLPSPFRQRTEPSLSLVKSQFLRAFTSLRDREVQRNLKVTQRKTLSVLPPTRTAGLELRQIASSSLCAHPTSRQRSNEQPHSVKPLLRWKASERELNERSRRSPHQGMLSVLLCTICLFTSNTHKTSNFFYISIVYIIYFPLSLD